jgi:hypothetical protein
MPKTIELKISGKKSAKSAWRSDTMRKHFSIKMFAHALNGL